MRSLGDFGPPRPSLRAWRDEGADGRGHHGQRVGAGQVRPWRPGRGWRRRGPGGRSASACGKPEGERDRLVFPLSLLAALISTPLLASDLGAVKARGSLRVLVATDEQPEMFSLQAGSAPGFDRELLTGFANLHRVTLEPVVKPFETIIADLVKDQGDLVVGLVDTEARRKLIDFTAELLPTRHVVLTRRPDPLITTLAALRA